MIYWHPQKNVRSWEGLPSSVCADITAARPGARVCSIFMLKLRPRPGPTWPRLRILIRRARLDHFMEGVVMLVNEFPPLPVGGAERQAERLSAYLAKRGWPVWVLTRRAPGLPASETRSGFQIVRPAALGRGKLQTVSFVLGALAELWRLRKNYSILHAHLAFGPAFAAVLAARFLGKRVVVKLGNSGEFGDIQVSQKTWRGRLRLSVFRRWADMVIVLDDAMQAEALSAGFRPERVRRMNNGIDARAFLATT